MADKFTSYPAFQGLILHDERFKEANIDTTLATPQQAGPEPDQPTADAGLKGFMQLEALGTTSAGKDYDVIAQKEGAAVGKDPGGRFRWKEAAEGSTEWRGHLNYNKVTGWEHVRFVSSGNGYTNPHAIRTPDHQAIVVYDDDVSSPREVGCSIRDPATDAWTHVSVDTPGGDDPSLPAVVRLPASGGSDNGGRLLCFYIRDDLSRGGTAYRTLGMSYSDDDGATWTVGGKHLSGFEELDSAFGGLRMRAVYHNGFITVLISGTDSATNTLWHLVSDDLGASFTEVEQITANTPQHATLFTDPAGTVGMVWKTTAGIVWGKKGTPFSTFADDPTYATVINGTGAEPAVVVADDGYLWIVFNLGSSLGYGIRVYDPGTMVSALDQWATFSGAANIYNPIGFTPILDNPALVQHKGSLLLLSNHDQTGGNSLMATHLGGYSSLDWVPQTFGYTEGVARDSGFTRLGFVAIGGTLTQAGTNSSTIGANGDRIQTTAPSGLRYRTITGGSNAEPIIVWSRHKIDSSGSLTSDVVALKLERADGSINFRATLRFASTSARLIDDVAAAQVGSDITGLASGTFYDWLIVMDGDTTGGNIGEIAVFYKLTTATKWTAGPTTATLQDAGAATAANTLVWGIHAAGTNEDATWAMLNSAMDDEPHDPGLTSFTNPDDLQGRQFSVNPLWLESGVLVRSRGSSAYRGDSWSAGTRYQFGTPNLDPQIDPSPAVRWRSTDTTQQDIAWSPAGSAVLTRMLSSTIGIYLGQTNIETALFQGRDSAGSWTTLATLDTRNGMTGLTYDRGSGGGLTSDWISPNASTTAGSRYVQMDELVGGYMVLDANASASGPYVRRIVRNTEGSWQASTSTRPMECLISGTLTGIPASDDCEIRFPNVCAVIHNVTTDYQAFRLRIEAATTEEGYFFIGALVVGPVAIFGTRYAWGRVQETSPNVRTSEDRARRRRKRKIGPVQRRATFAWVDPVETTELYQTTPDPRALFAHTSSGSAVAVHADASLLEGVMARSDGGALPVVYLPKIALASSGSTEAQIMCSREEILYGTIEGPVSRTSVLGNELTNEMQTVSAIEVLEHV